ncbi:MAG: DHA1 family multidrug resistance protein-like MFS transporter [Desulforhopalus sp.]|jgi:DHA1 family multidrug resistance protein-like MFS transporter
MQKYTLVTLLLSVFIALLGIGIIVPVMPIFAKELGASGFALGMIIAAFSVTRGLLQPVVGNLSDRWGRKGFLMAGLLIYGIVGMLIPMATDVDHLILIRAFHGIGSAMIVPIAMAYMSLLAPAGHESRYMSYLNVAIFSGIGCGPIIGGTLADFWGLSSVFYTMAGLSLLALMLVVVYMPRQVASGVEKDGGFLKSLSSMLGNRKTAGILIARYATMIIMVPSMAFLPLLMSDWDGVSGLQIGFVIASRTLVNAVLQVPFGKLADQYSKRKIFIVSCLILSIIVYCIPFFETVAVMAVLYLLLGCVEAAIWAVLGGYASLEAKEHYGHGTMMGMFGFAMSGGVFTGAVLAGTVMDRGGIALAYHVTGGTVLVLSIISFVMIAGAEKKVK